ncbi:MAG: homoserine kinase [Nocardioidaceae bacterium]|nr:homoserine kinase [Nocardioidaceae bacterium]
MGFLEGPVRVSVPATSANLGPGFDSLGLALDLRDELEAEVIPGGLEIEIIGEGADWLPHDDRHLVVCAMRRTFDLLGQTPTGIRLSCTNAIPQTRGLGSSSAAVVGGAWLARELVVGGRQLLDEAALLDLVAQIEGHPDNVAPALLGGFVIAGADDGGAFFAVSAPVDPRLSVVVFVPPTPVSTQAARGLLPDSVAHVEAAANAGRAALLVAALAAGPEHLLCATEDRLHQEYRRSAMPASLDLVDRLRAQGIAAVISGAGPTVLAFAGGSAAATPQALLAHCPQGWSARPLAISTRGATTVVH